MEPTPIVLRIEPPAHSERAQRVLSLLLLVALFFSGLDAAEHGSTTLGWICMAGAAAAAVAFLLLSRRHALVLRWTDAVNGGLFFVAAAGKLAHGKLALPLLQIVAGALLIAVAMLDLPAKRGRLVLDQGGITIRRSFLRRRSVPWTEVSAFALELAAVRIEHSGSPPHVLALRAQLTEAQASAVRRFAAERLQASRSAPGTAS